MSLVFSSPPAEKMVLVQSSENPLSYFDEASKTFNDLARDVYCVLGVPIDTVGMTSLLARMERAAASKVRFLLSTTNLNFLANCQTEPSFRDAMLLSDTCSADGISIVWIARVLGVSIKERVAGSDMIAALAASRPPAAPMKLFLFGGMAGVAETAYSVLNARQSGVYCVGWRNPGLGSVEEMSRPEMIDEINSSGADFLVVSLGAKKGQDWLLRNHEALRIPIRAHLGATLNFEAGTLKRAPHTVQWLGLEWLWRIIQEPHLWRRYWRDGKILLRLLLTRVLPLLVDRVMGNITQESTELSLVRVNSQELLTLLVLGDAISSQIDKVIPAFAAAVACNKNITLDFSRTRRVDSRFLGSLLMLSKALKSGGNHLTLAGLSPELARIFRLNGLNYMLSRAETQ